VAAADAAADLPRTRQASAGASQASRVATIM
jgi:hypothetical protein